MKRFWLWLPFGIFAGFFLIFARGLIHPSDRTVPSGMVGRAMPQFDLVGAIDPAAGFKTSALADGKPRLVNVFASWCVPCAAEAPALQELKNQGAEIVGIAIHDNPEALQKFLTENGNPYARIGDDPESRTQIAFGSAGVPETFVVDGKGIIRHQHIGVITGNDIPIILAKLRGAQ